MFIGHPLSGITVHLFLVSNALETFVSYIWHFFLVSGQKVYLVPLIIILMKSLTPFWFFFNWKSVPFRYVGERKKVPNRKTNLNNVIFGELCYDCNKSDLDFDTWTLTNKAFVFLNISPILKSDLKSGEFPHVPHPKCLQWNLSCLWLVLWLPAYVAKHLPQEANDRPSDSLWMGMRVTGQFWLYVPDWSAFLQFLRRRKKLRVTASSRGGFHTV